MALKFETAGVNFERSRIKERYSTVYPHTAPTVVLLMDVQVAGQRKGFDDFGHL